MRGWAGNRKQLKPVARAAYRRYWVLEPAIFQCFAGSLFVLLLSGYVARQLAPELRLAHNL